MTLNDLLVNLNIIFPITFLIFWVCILILADLFIPTDKKGLTAALAALGLLISLVFVIIRVDFTAPSSFSDNAWVGIIPSNVRHGSEAENDRFDLTFQYLSRQSSGTLVFKAPAQPGSYDLRMHDTDAGGKEVASVSFRVAEPVRPAAPSLGPSLKLSKTVFSPGKEISVEFTAPSSSPNPIGSFPTRMLTNRRIRSATEISSIIT